ncbi:hypothetical protein CDL15_Pgr008276 [Punica granatum]|uniref:Uncharacterized protein n=1 Tax=Punica granatum TaxID=22663 RepID=A0A218XVU0_PUNGR|nr:hypothetical protein CDL15_Pgr008276 [Punica granatum]
MGFRVRGTFVSGNLVITTLEWLDRDWGRINMFSLVASRHAQSYYGRLEEPGPMSTGESNRSN